MPLARKQVVGPVPMSPTKKLGASLAISLLLLALVHQKGYALDPWYADMAGHWAHNYVRVLWEEKVTDAYYSPPRANQYVPDRPMRRDAWLALLVGLFQLPPAANRYYVDISPAHQLGNGRQIGNYLHAAGRAGFYDSPDRRLNPALHLNRQHAVAGLIKALGLADYANRLSGFEVADLLRPFADANQIQPALRPLLAAAVKLQIMEGYPDGTLRPLAQVTRAEASALVARSALIRVTARPNPFSPDGDGFEDTTVFSLQGLRNRNARRWHLVITDEKGTVVWQTPPMLNRLPARLVWDGRRHDGTPLAAGTYYYQAFLIDNKGQEHQSVRMPIEIVYRYLDAHLAPRQVYPGDVFHLTATASGDVQHVYSFWAGGREELAPRDSVWTGSSRVPSGMPPGVYEVTVVGVYPRLQRQVRLQVEVLPDPGKGSGGGSQPPPDEADGRGEIIIILTD